VVEVATTLRRIHDNHEHFAHGITTNNAVGHPFWPTRAKDVQWWIQLCDACQWVSRLQKSDVYNPIKLTPSCPIVDDRRQ